MHNTEDLGHFIAGKSRHFVFICNVLWETASLALSIYSRVLCSDIHITEYFQQGSNSEICHFTKGTGAFHLVVCLYNFRERDRKRKEVGEGD